MIHPDFHSLRAGLSVPQQNDCGIHTLSLGTPITSDIHKMLQYLQTTPPVQHNPTKLKTNKARLTHARALLNHTHMHTSMHHRAPVVEHTPITYTYAAK